MDLFEKLKGLGNIVDVKERKGEDGTVKGFRIEITVGDPDGTESQGEIETRMEELEEELEHLEGLLTEVEGTEPFDLNTAAHKRWQARMDLVEGQIRAVEEELSGLEEEAEEK